MAYYSRRRELATLTLELGVARNHLMSQRVRRDNEPDSELLPTTKVSATPCIQTSDRYGGRCLIHLVSASERAKDCEKCGFSSQRVKC